MPPRYRTSGKRPSNKDTSAREKKAGQCNPLDQNIDQFEKKGPRKPKLPSHAPSSEIQFKKKCFLLFQTYSHTLKGAFGRQSRAVAVAATVTPDPCRTALPSSGQTTQNNERVVIKNGTAALKGSKLYFFYRTGGGCRAKRNTRSECALSPTPSLACIGSSALAQRFGSIAPGRGSCPHRPRSPHQQSRLLCKKQGNTSKKRLV